MDGTQTIPSNLWLVSDEPDTPACAPCYSAWGGWKTRADIEAELRRDYDDDRYDQQHAGAF